MRILLCILLALVLFASFAAADEVVLSDGTVVEGKVERIRVSGQGEYERARVLAVHLDGDRAAMDARRLERLLRFALERARSGAAADGDVGVYLGRGVFPPSAIAVVRRLDEAERAPRLLLETDMTTDGLRGLRAVVFPGGWAPSQLAGLGPTGQAALAEFVKDGGSYLGICAGGYLPCTSVVWEGASYPYPVGLVSGTATGPVEGRAPWPTSEVVELDLGEGNKPAKALYAGGSSFDVKDAEVLARYPGGTAAAIEVRHGKGRLLLTGAHVEMRTKTDADLLAEEGWATGLAPGDAALFDVYLKRVLRPRK